MEGELGRPCTYKRSEERAEEVSEEVEASVVGWSDC